MTEQNPRHARAPATVRPEAYSPATSESRAASLSYALAGCLYMLRTQKNARIMLAATALVVPLAVWLGIDADQWAILIMAIGGVWLAEFFNAAIEAAVNIAAPEIHPMAKVAKDVAAAAALIAVVVAILVGVLILGPPLALGMTASAPSN